MNKKFDKRDIPAYILIILVFLSIAAFFCMLVAQGYRDISNAIESYKEANLVSTRTVDLKSINYTNRLNGSFFLGFGSVNGTNYYVCYEELDDGGIKLLELPANKTIIYETLDTGTKAYTEIDEDAFRIHDIRLYVPVDTIQVEYALSLE